MAEAHKTNQLYFDPDLHPDDTLMAFNEFVQDFELRYDAKYTDPSKVSLEAAVERWKIMHAGQVITVEEYDRIANELRSKDRVAKFLGIYSLRRLFSDWKVAEPDEALRKRSTWDDFVKKIQGFYKPTENLHLEKLPVPLSVTRKIRILHSVLQQS